MDLKALIDFLKEKGVENIDDTLERLLLEIKEHFSKEDLEDDEADKKRIFGI